MIKKERDWTGVLKLIRERVLFIALLIDRFRDILFLQLKLPIDFQWYIWCVLKDWERCSTNRFKRTKIWAPDKQKIGMGFFSSSSRLQKFLNVKSATACYLTSSNKKNTIVINPTVNYWCRSCGIDQWKMPLYIKIASWINGYVPQVLPLH